VQAIRLRLYPEEAMSKKTKKGAELTAEQVEAVRELLSEFGAKWRSELNRIWMRGDVQTSQNHALYMLRKLPGDVFARIEEEVAR
jgi:hypothetical protein